MSRDTNKPNEATQMKLEQEQIIAYYTFVLGFPVLHIENGWIQTGCPFHHDPFESLRINPATGDWECCQCGAGSIHEFQMRAYSDNWGDADYEINSIISEECKSGIRANSFSTSARGLWPFNECSADVEP